MYKANIEEGPTKPASEVKRLREEVTFLMDQQAALTQQSLRVPSFMQKLGKTYGFGVAGKLEWTAFKLKFKQEQLAEYEQRNSHTLLAGNPLRVHLIATATETAQQKMERMISQNPAELEPHIRRAYQPLIAAEQ